MRASKTSRDHRHADHVGMQTTALQVLLFLFTAQPPAIAAQHPYIYEHLTRTPYAYTLHALSGPSPLLISHGLLKHSVLRSLHHPSSHASSAADDINMRALRACIPLPKRYSVAGSGDVANCFLASKDEGHIRTSPYRHTDTLALLVRDIVPWILLLGTRLEETEGLYCGEAVGDRK